jgi:hypothetical protein
MTALTNSEYAATSVERSIVRLTNARLRLRHDDARATGWYAGDPLNCAGCALAIEFAVQDCLTPRHVHTVACWDDVRCPNCRGTAP